MRSRSMSSIAQRMAAAADEIESKFGKIHLISNNAGIGPLTPLSGTEPKDFDQTVAVNLTGVYNGVHIFLPRIRKHGEGGHIITTSSMSGILPTEGGGAGAYTCTKFAVVGMMEILRSELETANANVGVSVYCPGLVNTNIFELAKNVSAAFSEPGTKAGPADAPVNEAFIRQIIGNGMDPIEAGQIVLAGIRNNDLFILSHPEFGPGIKERMDTLMASAAEHQGTGERVLRRSARRCAIRCTRGNWASWLGAARASAKPLHFRSQLRMWRSIFMRSRMRLAISSTLHSVTSTLGIW